MKLISFFISVIVFLSGTFPVLFDGKVYINPYGDEVHICEYYYFPETKVFSERETFSKYGGNGCMVYEPPEEYNSEYFENKSLVCFSVMETQDFRVWIKSITEDGDTLNVEYCVIKDTKLHAQLYTVYSCEIFIEVSKNIKNINLISSEKTIPFDVEKLPFEHPERF
ncbi:MAG: hypothetical protein E7516_00185 [Ruminococcaceae bacterium]|nr:hypothetical protein [Oscillospiraceae bacterium]